MERVFWVKNGELETVNEWLQQGGRVKMIKPVSETFPLTVTQPQT